MITTQFTEIILNFDVSNNLPSQYIKKYYRYMRNQQLHHFKNKHYSQIHMKLQTKLDHVQDHIGNVRKFQEIIMQNLFSDHNAIKLEIRKKNQ